MRYKNFKAAAMRCKSKGKPKGHVRRDVCVIVNTQGKGLLLLFALLVMVLSTLHIHTTLSPWYIYVYIHI